SRTRSALILYIYPSYTVLRCCAQCVSASSLSLVFFSLLPPPPRSTLFPYTTLFRSCSREASALVETIKIGLPSQELPRKQGKFLDRKSTRLNSSHGSISYAVFCLKKKKKKAQARTRNSDKIHTQNERSTKSCAHCML